MSWAEEGQTRCCGESPPRDSDGDITEPSTDAMLDILANQVELLQKKMDDEVRRTSYCSVCYAKPFVWVFKCGHAKCDDCAVQLQKRGCQCPECRQDLEDPRRLFWAACG